MAYNPFTAVQTQQSLLDALSKGEFGRKIGTIKKEERISEDVKEFEEELKRLEEEAKKEAEKNKGLFGGLNILSSFLGPVGGAIVGGLTSVAQGKQQQKAMEKLLKLSPKKYGKSHLTRSYKKYIDKAKGMQIESGDIYKDALKSSLGSWVMSKAMYGGEKDPTKAIEGPKKGLFGKPGGFMSGEGKLSQMFGKPKEATVGVDDKLTKEILDVSELDPSIAEQFGPTKPIDPTKPTVRSDMAVKPSQDFQPGRGGAFGVIKRGGGFGGGGLKHLGRTITQGGGQIADDSGIMTLLALLGQGMEG